MDLRFIWLHLIKCGGKEIVQPETVAAGAKMLVSIYPSIPFLIGVGLLFFYGLIRKWK
jgi:hypothetical protein